jgi:hypothetical protein
MPEATATYGDLDQLDDGRWQLRFTRVLSHPVEKVWRAITEPDHLAHWFPTTIEGERAAGAPLRFSFEEDQWPARDGAGWHTCLDALERAMAGRDDAREATAEWSDVHRRYVESFGPEAATIGAPERS